MMKEIDSLTLDDLQEQHRQYAEVIGVDNLLKLSRAFGGSSMYVPQERELIKNKVYHAISREFDGSNMKKLAAKYRVSESTVYNIVRDQIHRGSKYNIPGQYSIMDLYGS